MVSRWRASWLIVEVLSEAGNSTESIVFGCLPRSLACELASVGDLNCEWHKSYRYRAYRRIELGRMTGVGYNPAPATESEGRQEKLGCTRWKCWSG